MICPQHGRGGMVCLEGQTKVRDSIIRTSKSHGAELGEMCVKGQYVVEKAFSSIPG